jgi:flagellar biosynthesis/type III secretory pathway protein FliH
MRAIKEARHLIEETPNDESAQILAQLVLALETEVNFAISDIYKLNRSHFELAIRILQEWRLERYYVGKARLFDTAFHVAELGQKS